MLRWLLSKFRFRRRKIIVIAPRWNDVWAGLANSDGKCGAGKSVYEALGNLVISHQEEFGIDIKLAFGDKPGKPLGESYVTISEKQYDLLMYKAGWSRK